MRNWPLPPATFPLKVLVVPITLSFVLRHKTTSLEKTYLSESTGNISYGDDCRCTVKCKASWKEEPILLDILKH